MDKKPHPNTKPFSWTMLEGLCRYKASLKDCSELLKVSEDTVMGRIRERYDTTFSEYRDKKMATTRMTMTQKAIAMAKNGNTTMMIFCLKNLCKWTDRYDIETKVEHSVDVEFAGILKDMTSEDLVKESNEIRHTLKLVNGE